MTTEPVDKNVATDAEAFLELLGLSEYANQPIPGEQYTGKLGKDFLEISPHSRPMLEAFAAKNPNDESYQEEKDLYRGIFLFYFTGELPS